jgi:AcrR family transcriptional regulator
LSSPDTKERILDTAEKLFAEEGFAGTSLRAITAEAGVNLAAIHYHFGGKEDLIQAVFLRRLAPLHRERLDLLEACETDSGSKAGRLERILEAFVGPPLRISRDPKRGGEVFMRLLGRIHTEPGEHFKKIYCEQFVEVMSRFFAALQRELPQLSPVELHWRVHFLHGAMGQVLAGLTKLKLLSGGLCQELDADGVLEHLVPFLAAGLRAPAPHAGDSRGGVSRAASDQASDELDGSSPVLSQEVGMS